MLYDFIKIRIKSHMHEGVNGISDEVLQKIREKQYKDMSQCT